MSMEVILPAHRAARFAGLYSMRKAGYVLRSARVLGALGYSVEVIEPAHGLSARGTSDDKLFSGRWCVSSWSRWKSRWTWASLSPSKEPSVAVKLAPCGRTFLIRHMPGAPPTLPSTQSCQRELSHGLFPIPVRSSVWWDTATGTITPSLDLAQFVIDHAVTRGPHLPQDHLPATPSTPQRITPRTGEPTIAGGHPAARPYVPLISRPSATINAVSTPFTFLAFHGAWRP